MFSDLIFCRVACFFVPPPSGLAAQKPSHRTILPRIDPAPCLPLEASEGGEISQTRTLPLSVAEVIFLCAGLFSWSLIISVVQRES